MQYTSVFYSTGVLHIFLVHDKSTDEYKKACDITDSWGELLNRFENAIVSLERKDGRGEKDTSQERLVKLICQNEEELGSTLT